MYSPAQVLGLLGLERGSHRDPEPDKHLKAIYTALGTNLYQSWLNFSLLFFGALLSGKAITR